MGEVAIGRRVEKTVRAEGIRRITATRYQHYTE
jgi:hypothetical protein